MDRVNATIETEPVAKGRPKTMFRNGKAWTYTPTKTKDTESIIRTLVLQQIKEAYPAYTPIALTVTFYRTRSQYAPKEDIMPVRKPDLDNLLKTVLDSLNGIAFADDAQITTIHTSKRWSDNEHGYITLEMVGDEL